MCRENRTNGVGRARERWAFKALCMVALLACGQTAQAVPEVDLETLISPAIVMGEGETRTYRLRSSEPAPQGGLRVRVTVEQRLSTKTDAIRESAGVPSAAEYTEPQLLDPRESGERSVRFNSGETTKEFTVRMSPADGLRKWPFREQMEIEILDDAAYTVGTRSVTQAIEDDRKSFYGQIQVAANSAESNVLEDAGFIDVEFRLIETHAFRVKRSFTLGGTGVLPKATNGVDYRFEGPMYVEFPPLVTKTSIRIGILDDKRVEGERYTLPTDTNAIVYGETIVLSLGTEASEVLVNDSTKAKAEIYILDDDSAPLVMKADNVTEGQDIRIHIGVDPAAGGCDKTFPFLVDLTVASQTPGILEGSRRSGNTLGPTLPPLRTVRLESCADTTIETYRTVENETDEGERAATFSLSNLRRASATNPPAGNPLRVFIADGVESVSVYDNDATASDFVAVTDYVHMAPGTQSIDIDVLENDFVRNSSRGALTIEWTSQPANGTVEIIRRWVRYTPDEGFSGIDTFEYRVQTGGTQNTARVEVDVQANDEAGWLATWTGVTTLSEGGAGLTVSVANQNTASTRTEPAYVNVKIRAVDDGAGPADLEVTQSGETLVDRLLGRTTTTGSGAYIATHGGTITIKALTDTDTEYTERMVLELFAEGRRVSDGRREIMIANQQGAVTGAPTVNVSSDTRALEMNEGDGKSFELKLSAAAANDLDVEVMVTSPEGPDGYPRFDDGHIGPRIVHFAAGHTSATVEVVSHNDDVLSKEPAGDEQFVNLTIVPGSGYVVGTHAAGTLKIVDGSYVEERDENGDLTGNVVFDPEADGARLSWVGECGKPVQVIEGRGPAQIGVEITKGRVTKDFTMVLVNREGSGSRHNDYVDADATGSLIVLADQAQTFFEVGIVEHAQVEPRSEKFEISLFRNGIGDEIIVDCKIVHVEIIDEDEVNFTMGDRVRRVTEGQPIELTTTLPEEDGDCLMPSPVTMHLTPAGATNVLAAADQVTKEVAMPPCTGEKTGSFATVVTAGDQGTQTVYFDVLLETSWEPDRVKFEGGFTTVRFTVHVDDSEATTTIDPNQPRTIDPPPGKGPKKPPAPTPITPSLRGLPGEHDGTNPFTFELHFSPTPRHVSYRTVQGSLFTIGNGRITKASRMVKRQHGAWSVTVQPSGTDDISIRLNPTPDCEAKGAICTPEGGALTAGLTRTVQGPPVMSIADASVDEAEGVTLDFEVSLSRAASGRTSVDYATSDGTATAGPDYDATSGTLVFAAGETRKNIAVIVHDDAHNEGSETMTLTLTNPSGARLGDASATGTINNTDPMPTAWMIRMGRTVGSQVMEGLTERLEGGDHSRMSVAGASLGSSGELGDILKPRDPFAITAWDDQDEDRTRTMSMSEVLASTAFHMSNTDAGSADGPRVAVWGRFAQGRFETEENKVTTDGKITTGMMGLDAKWGSTLAGLMLTQTKSEGAYQLGDDDEGTVESDLTGIYPYASVDLSAKASAWVLAGVGTGELTLRSKKAGVMPTDLSMRLGAIGVKGQILNARGPSGIELSVKSDAMWVEVKNHDTDEMIGTKANATRVRLMLHGEWVFANEYGTQFVPNAEIGVRHDSGDAETGTGIELGAGGRYQAGSLSIEARARALIVHEAEGYGDWGLSAAMRLDPSASGRGMTLSIAPQWGRAATGTHQLWSTGNTNELGSRDAFEPETRIAVDAGYGFGAGPSRGVLTPYTGVTFGGTSGNTLRSGTKWQITPEVAFGIEYTQSDETSEVWARTALRF